MSLGPRANHRKTVRKRLAAAAVVDILHVQHLKTWLPHQACWIKRRVGGETGLGGEHGSLRSGEEAAFGVAVDIELDLADAIVELSFERRMAVCQRLGGARVQLA